MNGEATTPPTLRIPAEIHGRSNAQSSTRKRGWRGSGCSRSSAIEIIVASQGRMPAWFEVSSARPCAGTRSAPSTFTRHHDSYRNAKNGSTSSAKSSSKPHSSSE